MTVQIVYKDENVDHISWKRKWTFKEAAIPEMVRDTGTDANKGRGAHLRLGWWWRLGPRKQWRTCPVKSR